MNGKKKGAQPAPSSNNARRGPRAAPSIISTDMTVLGALTAAGDIQVDGVVEGDITTFSLTIGDKATIHGEIVAEEVVIRGRVIGSIRANRVQLCSTCHVEGDILHNALAVEAGAFFEGNCRHSENPLYTGSGTESSGSAGIAAYPTDEASYRGRQQKPQLAKQPSRAPVPAALPPARVPQQVQHQPQPARQPVEDTRGLDSVQDFLASQFAADEGYETHQPAVRDQARGGRMPESVIAAPAPAPVPAEEPRHQPSAAQPVQHVRAVTVPNLAPQPQITPVVLGSTGGSRQPGSVKAALRKLTGVNARVAEAKSAMGEDETA